MCFPTAQFWSCGNQVTNRVSDWSNVPNRSLGDRVDVFAATVISSNLLFHCFVRCFIQHNGVCNVLNKTEIVANFRKARLRLVMRSIVLVFGSQFWQNYRLQYFKAVFLVIDLFGIIAIQSVISLEIKLMLTA